MVELAVVEEILKPVETRRTIQSVQQTRMQTLTSARIEELSAIAAQNTIDGFIAQDRYDFDAASLHFSVVFQTLFPEFDSERILKAAEAYVSALFTQSKLKDDNFDKTEKLHDRRWEFVQNELLRMCSLLGLPSSYAIETCNLYRYHSVRDDCYVKHLLESHRVLLKRIAGNDSNYREIAGLYLSAIACHDKHSQFGVTKGRELMQLYYNIIFHSRNMS